MHVEHNVDLNNELLEPLEEDLPQEPKRNSKEDLVSKIINVCADNDLELEHSNSKLKRMTKTQLAKILAEKIEYGVKSQMAKQVGAGPNAPDGVIALGALKMIHNILAQTTEKGLNAVLPAYGYEVDGFCQNLKDPTVDEAVTQCLSEIALESDVMQYVESPYVRLGLAWGGALVTSVRKRAAPLRKRDVTAMGPKSFEAEDSLQRSVGRRPQAGQVDRGKRSDFANVRSV